MTTGTIAADTPIPVMLGSGTSQRSGDMAGVLPVLSMSANGLAGTGVSFGTIISSTPPPSAVLNGILRLPSRAGSRMLVANTDPRRLEAT